MAKKARGAQQFKDRLGQAPQKNLKLRSCVSAHPNPAPFSTPWPCVVWKVILSEADVEGTTWQEHGAPCQVTTTDVPVTFTSPQPGGWGLNPVLGVSGSPQ